MANNGTVNGGSEPPAAAAAPALPRAAPHIVELNVGGVHYTTSRETLLGRAMEPSGTMLSAMFSGRWETSRDAGGRVFIDRDGGRFGALLNYLRGGGLGRDADLCALREEADFFGMERLSATLGEEREEREIVAKEQDETVDYSLSLDEDF